MFDDAAAGARRLCALLPASPTRCVREFVQGAFAHIGRRIELRGSLSQRSGWKLNQPLVSINPRYFRPTEVEQLLGNPAKAKRKLGWRHRIGFTRLIAEMMESDLKRMPHARSAMAPSELPFRIEGRRIWVAGRCGIVGSALVRRLAREGCELLTFDRDRIDLRRQTDVEAWMSETKPEVVILAAARVGGVSADARRAADFLDDNLASQTNVIHCAAEIGVLFLGSTCIYPGLAPQPISESALLTGRLEPTNQWYAIAEIAGLTLCQAYREQHGCDFISVMPSAGE
jgi:nucleoside-diphosphate-sugar epimerase